VENYYRYFITWQSIIFVAIQIKLIKIISTKGHLNRKETYLLIFMNKKIFSSFSFSLRRQSLHHRRDRGQTSPAGSPETRIVENEAGWSRGRYNGSPGYCYFLPDLNSFRLFLYNQHFLLNRVQTLFTWQIQWQSR
jgi:hypothetical protein